MEGSQKSSERRYRERERYRERKLTSLNRICFPEGRDTHVIPSTEKELQQCLTSTS
jgi:hypothetical protein